MPGNSKDFFPGFPLIFVHLRIESETARMDFPKG